MDVLLDVIESNPLYWVALGFFAGYPIVSSLVWMSTAVTYFLRRERGQGERPMPLSQTPTVSVLVPAYNEQAHIAETVQACLALDYPDFEVVVVDDGSTDATVEGKVATEDIDVTWKLQKRFYDVRYEPGARVWMRVPTTLRGLWRQRRRWATGLSQVLRRHGRDVFTDWRRRRMRPVASEAVLSVAWAYLLFLGVMLDRRYDRGLARDFPVAVVYPLVYWILMSIVNVVSTPAGLLRRHQGGPAQWHTVRGT